VEARTKTMSFFPIDPPFPHSPAHLTPSFPGVPPGGGVPWLNRNEVPSSPLFSSGLYFFPPLQHLLALQALSIRVANRTPLCAASPVSKFCDPRINLFNARVPHVIFFPPPPSNGPHISVLKRYILFSAFRKPWYSGASLSPRWSLSDDADGCPPLRKALGFPQ